MPKILLKGLATVLLASFALQEISFAQGGRSAEVLVADAHATQEFRIPQSLAEIQKSTVGDSQEKIIHIQDAHDSLEAQRKITEILGVLTRDYEVRSIALEGSSGAIDPLLFKSYPDQTVAKESAEALMKEGRLNAGELFAITSEEPVSVYGVENRTLYRENLKVFKDLLKKREELTKERKGLPRTLEALAERVYSEKIKSIRQHAILSEKGNLSFSKKWQVLESFAKEKNIDFQKYPNLKVLSGVSVLESGIHFSKANDERAKLLSLFKETLKGAELEEVFKKSLDFKRGKLPESDYHRFLLDTAGRQAVDLGAYPNLKLFTEYLQLFDSLDLAGVIEELETFQGQIEEAYFFSEDERNLYQLEKELSILINLVSGTASSKEFDVISSPLQADEKSPSSRRSLGPSALEMTEKYSLETTGQSLLRLTQKHNVPLYEGARIDKLLEALPTALRFYTLAKKRDEILLQNTLKKMRAQNQRVAALVTGGFHAQGISQILKDQNLSSLVVLPKITDPNKKRPYITILTRKSREVEEAFSSDSSRYKIMIGTLLDAGRANPYSASDVKQILLPLVEGLKKKGRLKEGIDEWMTAYREAYRGEPSKNYFLHPEKIEAILYEMTRVNGLASMRVRGLAGERVNGLKEGVLPAHPHTRTPAHQRSGARLAKTDINKLLTQTLTLSDRAGVKTGQLSQRIHELLGSEFTASYKTLFRNRLASIHSELNKDSKDFGHALRFTLESTKNQLRVLTGWNLSQADLSHLRGLIARIDSLLSDENDLYEVLNKLDEISSDTDDLVSLQLDPIVRQKALKAMALALLDSLHNTIQGIDRQQDLKLRLQEIFNKIRAWHLSQGDFSSEDFTGYAKAFNKMSEAGILEGEIRKRLTKLSTRAGTLATIAGANLGARLAVTDKFLREKKFARLALSNARLREPNPFMAKRIEQIEESLKRFIEIRGHNGEEPPKIIKELEKLIQLYGNHEGKERPNGLGAALGILRNAIENKLLDPIVPAEIVGNHISLYYEKMAHEWWPEDAIFRSQFLSILAQIKKSIETFHQKGARNKGAQEALP